jgi:hypothetical protein
VEVAISASTWRTSTATDTQMIMHALINEAAYMALGHKVDLESAPAQATGSGDGKDRRSRFGLNQDQKAR